MGQWEKQKEPPEGEKEEEQQQRRSMEYMEQRPAAETAERRA